MTKTETKTTTMTQTIKLNTKTMGSHYDHYFLSYQNFSPEKPADEGVSI